MDASDSHALLAPFALAFSQRDRSLVLRFGPSAAHWGDALLPDHLVGREALNDCYHYTLACLSSNALLAIHEIVGEPIEIGIRTASGALRRVCGLVTAARSVAADGGFARFEFTIEPALAVHEHHRLARVFQDQSVPAIVQTILDEQIATNAVVGAAFRVVLELDRAYPPRSYCVAYRESASAVSFLVARVGKAGLLFLTSRLGEGRPFEQALVETGLSYTELQQAWESSLRLRDQAKGPQS